MSDSEATDKKKMSTGRIEEKYIIKEKLGKGAFSIVYRGENKETGEDYAIKAINKKYIKEKLLEREIEIMTTTLHKNILFCKEVFDSDVYIYLVLELVHGGELYDKITDDGEYTEDEAKLIILQILDAVEYLHQKGIAHRDLKPENILCMKKTDPGSFRKEEIKVADFGLSKMFKEEQLISQCGSPTYVAPEILLARPYTNSVDMWSLGVLTFVLLTGCFPFFEEENKYSVLYQKIIAVDYEFPDDIDLSPEAKDFISKLLVFDANLRPTATECKRHPWLQNTTL